MDSKRLKRSIVTSVAIAACAVAACYTLTGCIRSDGQMVWPNIKSPGIRQSPKLASVDGRESTNDWLSRRSDGTYRASGVVGITGGWTTSGGSEWGRMDLLVLERLGGVKVWTAVPLFYDERTRLSIDGSPSSENVAEFVDWSERTISLDELTFKERTVEAVFRRDGRSFRLESLDVPTLPDQPVRPWPRGRAPGR